MRRPWLRSLAHGLLAGALLSWLRAPLGLDWTQLGAVGGRTALLFRAGALLGIALSLDSTRLSFRGGPSPVWFAALAAGFLVHGLELARLPEPSDRAAFALSLLVATLCLRLLAGPRALDGGPVQEPLHRRERLGLVLVGLGCALSLEALAREARLFTLGLRADETLLGGVFLVLVWIGAQAFGGLGRRAERERARLAGGLALSAAAALVGLSFLARLSPAGLFAQLRRFDGWLGPLRALDGRLDGALGLSTLPALDGTAIGTCWATALLGAAAFVVPCFTLGAAVGGARNAGRIAHALVGAAFGLVLFPQLVGGLARPIGAEELARASWSWTLVVAGSTLSGIGVLVAAASLERGRARWASLALALAAIVLPWARPRLVLWSFSPWSATPITPELVFPTAEGLVTVEPARGGPLIATLDRRRLTPTSDEEAADEARLRAAFALLARERSRPVRTLLIGQLTPARLRVLRDLGELELERTASWFAAYAAVEERLFRGEEPPPGRVIPPGEARARIRSGEYDWIVVPPVHGPVLLWKSESRERWGSSQAPRLWSLEVPEGTLGVLWIAADSDAARAELGERVLLVQERFDQLALGVPVGTVRDRGAGLPPLFETGPPLFEPGLRSVLGILPLQRAMRLEAALTRRISRACEGGRLADLARGLALHFAAQETSSPYETRAQQVELDEEELRAFLAALQEQAPGPPGDLDPFTRELWEALAWLITEKRLPELAWAYLEPVAERHRPWPALDRALGRAYRELLEPEAALSFLERALAEQPYDIALLVECGEAARELGDPARAVEFLERALAIQPGRADLERALGLVLVEAGEARGRELLERLLRERPDDVELRSALGLPDKPEHLDGGGG
jgi:tetratricopeptide (TPR) repeat protein